MTIFVFSCYNSVLWFSVLVWCVCLFTLLAVCLCSKSQWSTLRNTIFLLLWDCFSIFIVLIFHIHCVPYWRRHILLILYQHYFPAIGSKVAFLHYLYQAANRGCHFVFPMADLIEMWDKWDFEPFLFYEISDIYMRLCLVFAVLEICFPGFCLAALLDQGRFR